MASVQGYLLDTCIVVHLLRGGALGTAIDAQFDLQSNFRYSVVSIVTVGELRSLSGQFHWGIARISALVATLGALVQVDINHAAIIDAYAELDVQSRSIGRRMGKNDLWIAATATASGLDLLTTDADFDHLFSAGVISGTRLDSTTGLPIP